MLWSSKSWLPQNVRWKEPHLESSEDRPLNERTLTLRAVVPYCLAIITIAPSILHFSVVGAQFEQNRAVGLLTLVAAWLQLLWALAVVVQPSRTVWWQVGAILNSAIIVVDVATFMVGGAAGFGAAASTLFEALVVLGCVWLLVGKRDYQVGRDALSASFGGVGILTATVLSVSLIAGGPNTVNATSAPAPALDRHGLQANVPLPAGVSFAGLHQTVRVPDMQYHSNTSIDAWGWTVSGRDTVAVQNFYITNLSKHGWAHVQGQSVMDKIGNHGRCQVARGCDAAKHLTACQAGQVLLISASGSTLNTVGIGASSTATITAPRGGVALLIEIDRSPQAAQVACPASR